MLGSLGKALLFAEWELVRVTPELLGALLAHPSPQKLASDRSPRRWTCTDSRLLASEPPKLPGHIDVLVSDQLVCIRLVSHSTKRALTNTLVCLSLPNLGFTDCLWGWAWHSVLTVVLARSDSHSCRMLF